MSSICSASVITICFLLAVVPSYILAADREKYFISGGEIWKVDASQKFATPISSTGGNVREIILSADRKFIFFHKRGAGFIVNTPGGPITEYKCTTGVINLETGEALPDVRPPIEEGEEYPRGHCIRPLRALDSNYVCLVLNEFVTVVGHFLYSPQSRKLKEVDFENCRLVSKFERNNLTKHYKIFALGGD